MCVYVLYIGIFQSPAGPFKFVQRETFSSFELCSYSGLFFSTHRNKRQNDVQYIYHSLVVSSQGTRFALVATHKELKSELSLLGTIFFIHKLIILYQSSLILCNLNLFFAKVLCLFSGFRKDEISSENFSSCLETKIDIKLSCCAGFFLLES